MSEAELSLFVVGITQCFKMVGLDSKYLPFMAVVLGSLYGFSQDMSVNGAVKGALFGMIATGVVSTVDDRLRKVGLPMPPSGTL